MGVGLGHAWLPKLSYQSSGANINVLVLRPSCAVGEGPVLTTIRNRATAAFFFFLVCLFKGLNSFQYFLLKISTLSAVHTDGDGSIGAWTLALIIWRCAYRNEIAGFVGPSYMLSCSFMNILDKNDRPCFDVDHISDQYVLFSSPLASTLFHIISFSDLSYYRPGLVFDAQEIWGQGAQQVQGWGVLEAQKIWCW